MNMKANRNNNLWQYAEMNTSQLLPASNKDSLKMVSEHDLYQKLSSKDEAIAELKIEIGQLKGRNEELSLKLANMTSQADNMCQQYKTKTSSFEEAKTDFQKQLQVLIVQNKFLHTQNQKMAAEKHEQATFFKKMADDFRHLGTALMAEKLKTQDAEQSLERLRKYTEEREKEWDTVRKGLLLLCARYERNAIEATWALASERRDLEQSQYQVRFLTTSLKAKHADFQQVIDEKSSAITHLEESVKTEKVRTKQLEISLTEKQEETQTTRASLEHLQKIIGEQKEKLNSEREKAKEERFKLSKTIANLREKAEKETSKLSETIANLRDELETKDKQHQEFADHMLERVSSLTQQIENTKPKKHTFFKWFKRQKPAVPDASLPPSS
ncbi:synaptonemal complex protein 2-like [Austrofundulus limnaeus]|uniref:Synaptonemal complex protein 2-like n=1 Tax=Austrofundulus limnaeus TaxID=52670 RepID=A0A2I4ATK3_AUSLI|nr:PREDICTED: synaptonemal complex protein 2-like [Austrofundulus limnaeus]